MNINAKKLFNQKNCILKNKRITYSRRDKKLQPYQNLTYIYREKIKQERA
jgi:hypothetical protein